jgi:hypothetical protein
MNTPIWMDIYLIQNCKINFVLERMMAVHGEEEYRRLSKIDLTAPAIKFQKKQKNFCQKSRKERFSGTRQSL